MIKHSLQGSVTGAIAGTLLLLAFPVIAQVAVPHGEFVPNTTGSVAEASVPLLSQADFVAQFGYVEEEYLMAGTASVYDYVDNASKSPLVQVVQADLPYKTRLLVRRPANPARFNGTVYLEILNSTRDYDSDIDWHYAARMIMREGAVYVGMTSKTTTVEFLRDLFGRPPLKVRNFSRYASLSMAHDGQVWDMLSQTAALLKTDTEPSNPLAGWGVQRIIMMGYSQSAGYVKTYVNSFHNDAILADGRMAIDGYFEGAGSFASKVPNPPDPSAEFNELGDPRNKILLPVPAPLIRFQTGTEVTSFFNSFATRQTEEESPLIRTYEMAGGAHVDGHQMAFEEEQNIAELGLESSIPLCPNPSTLRVEYVHSALLSRLDDWIEHGRPPPPSRLLTLVPTGLGNGALKVATDSDGNPLGGVRLPQLEVPTGVWSGGITDFFCLLNGHFVPFSDEELARRYPYHRNYVWRTVSAARNAYRQGFLLPADAWEIILEASMADIGKRPPPRRWWRWRRHR